MLNNICWIIYLLGYLYIIYFHKNYFVPNIKLLIFYRNFGNKEENYYIYGISSWNDINDTNKNWENSVWKLAGWTTLVCSSHFSSMAHVNLLIIPNSLKHMVLMMDYGPYDHITFTNHFHLLPFRKQCSKLLARIWSDSCMISQGLYMLKYEWHTYS